MGALVGGADSVPAIWAFTGPRFSVAPGAENSCAPSAVVRKLGVRLSVPPVASTRPPASRLKLRALGTVVTVPALLRKTPAIFIAPDCPPPPAETNGASDRTSNRPEGAFMKLDPAG